MTDMNELLEKPVNREQLLTFTQALFPGAVIGVYRRPGFPFFYINNDMLNCLGYTKCDSLFSAYNSSMLEAVHPEEREELSREIINQLEQNGRFDVIFRMRKKDGSFCWLEQQGRSFRLEDGDEVIIGYCIDVTRLKEQESQLQLYRKASLGGAFLVRLDDDFTLLYGNDIYYKVHEYTPEGMMEKIGNRCREYVHPDDLPNVRSVIGQALASGSPTVEWEMRVITGKGNVRWISASAAFEHKRDEVLVNGFVIDNTRHHEIAEEKDRKEKWYQIAVSQTATNVWEYDLKSRYIFLNDSSERRHGYTEKVENVPESLISNGYIHPDSWEDFKSMYQQLWDGKSHVQADIKTRTVDGKGWWWERISYTMEYDSQGKPFRAVAVGENITQEKENELKYQIENRRRMQLAQEVQYREKLFDMLSQDVDNIYILLGNKSQDFLQYVSPNLERILGIRPEQLANSLSGLESCIPDKADAVRWRKNLEKIGKGKMLHQELCFRNASTEQNRWMEAEIREMDISGMKGLLLVLNDRTEAKIHEERLAEALSAAERANQAKSRFLSNMSHDIRTPMNAIIGMTDIAAMHLERQDKVKDCLEKISRSSQHLLGLINDILDMSEIESGRMTLRDGLIQLPEVLENVEAIILPGVKEKGQKFSIMADQIRHTYFHGDALRLRQIFLNILSNSCKFTPDGGEITLRIEEREEPGSDISRLEMRFRDTGIGMKPEFLEYIFDMFMREKDGRIDKIQGSGLGMAITKRIVEMMGGVIEVESSLGAGTEFFVSIPLRIADSDKAQKKEDAGTQNYDFGGKHFLLAEDNELNCEIAVELLSHTGADIHTACNGREAVEAFERSQEGYYDLILMDIQMPVMNGYAAAERIRGLEREDASTVPICAMTADAFAQDIERAKKAGMNEHFAKPLDIAKVNEGIGRLFEKHVTKEMQVRCSDQKD